MRVGQARRRDANEQAIVKALRQVGCVVLPLSGDAVPDLLVHRLGFWLPLEVKRPKGRLTPAQQRRQQLAPCPIVTSPAEALAVFGVVL